MEYQIHGYEPESFFRHFEEISAIPRSSGNEEAVSAFLMNFAAGLGLEAKRDQLWDVVIYKPGSAGCENLPPIMLQGHTDMVCEKNASTVHDFSKDGIALFVENGILRAKGTTLGADNGVAVAMMMALLEDKDLRHPPLECVFTTQEEVGLNGAAALAPSLLRARTMINLDSEEEGIATVSCAGGKVVRLFHPFAPKENSGPHSAVRVFVTGLRGGHSGSDIHLERANANLLMGRLLHRAGEGRELFLVSLNGGAKDNAIPRECEAIFYGTDDKSREDAVAAMREEAEAIRQELAVSEPNTEIVIETRDPIGGGDAKAFSSAVNLLMLVPNGVQNRNLSAGGFIVCSINLGVIRTEGGQVGFTLSLRSSVPSLMDYLTRRVLRLSDTLGFSAKPSDGYPGWTYAENSPIREAFCDCYRKLFGKELRCEAIHAGLECGLFAGKLPGLDSIAVGPDVRNCHTPEEQLDLGSCERTYRLITAVLEKLAAAH